MPSDWDVLAEAAHAAMARAYAPYSHYPVGAAALVDDGRVVTGCNVENAAYGVTLCAECGLVSDLVNSGGGRLVKFACVGVTAGPSCRAGGAANSCGSTAVRPCSSPPRPA